MEQFMLIPLGYIAYLGIVGLFVGVAWHTESGEPENQGRTIWDEILPPDQEPALRRPTTQPAAQVSRFMPGRFEHYYA